VQKVDNISSSNNNNNNNISNKSNSNYILTANPCIAPTLPAAL
jgi:hypothetical protein